MDSDGATTRWSQVRRVLKLLTGATLVGLPFHYLGVPAGMLLGSIFGAALVNQRWFNKVKPSAFPRSFRNAGLITVGVISGVLLTTESLISTATIALPIVIAYLCLAAVNLLFITLLMSRYGIDPGTAVLAVTPGGLGEITSMAIDKGANISVVVTIHTVRLFALVLLILPILVWVFTP